VQEKRGEEVNLMFHSLFVIFAMATEEEEVAKRKSQRKRRDVQRTEI
jgi:hypothetical protein